jgi:hypothetical protein
MLSGGQPNDRSGANGPSPLPDKPYIQKRKAMHNERLSTVETAKGKPEVDYYHLYRQELAKLMEARSAEEVERIGGELRNIVSAIRSKATASYTTVGAATGRDGLSPDKTL